MGEKEKKGGWKIYPREEKRADRKASEWASPKHLSL